MTLSNLCAYIEDPNWQLLRNPVDIYPNLPYAGYFQGPVSDTNLLYALSQRIT